MATMTRRQVAARLGVSLATVRRMEGTQLFPEVGDDEVRRFQPDEVEHLAFSRGRASLGGAVVPSGSATPSMIMAASDTGELAASVFAALDGGQHPTDVVIQKRLAPDVVRRLHADWMAMRGVNIHSPQVVQRLVELESRVTALEQQASSVENQPDMVTVDSSGKVLEQMLAQFRRAIR